MGLFVNLKSKLISEKLVEYITKGTPRFFSAHCAAFSWIASAAYGLLFRRSVSDNEGMNSAITGR